jgi:polysaccharide deacetylase 2 family uncharacterized protein YibQ
MLAPTTFAKRAFTATKPPPGARRLRLPAIFATPWALPAGAAVLITGATLVFVAVTSDPKAGAPSVRVSLETPGAGPGAAAGGMRPGLAGDTPLPNAPGAGPDVGGSAGSDPLTEQIGGFHPGQAVITLPQGASVSGGGSPVAATVRPKAQSLTPAPIAGLTAPGPGGLLPVIAKDGRTPFQAYARPFQSNGKPRIAVVVGALGLNGAATRAAIEKLPPEVTLSFTPYADGLQGWLDLARANGHEVMVELPMEPLDYPANDPGPYTLMASASPADTAKKLEYLLARGTGYFAVSNYMGGRFMASEPAMAALINALRARGVGYVDDGSVPRRGGGGTPRASADSVIDETPSGEAIDQQLARLEVQATQKGQALGIGFAYGVTLDKVVRWASALQSRGYQLAPASAVMRK